MLAKFNMCARATHVETIDKNICAHTTHTCMVTHDTHVLTHMSTHTTPVYKSKHAHTPRYDMQACVTHT